ncbi:MAG TPA: hypothetical protein VLC09_18120 [Polyangiaceae bacterium]|nr:hypothetical protein [Polyangiaceae bacterium]
MRALRGLAGGLVVGALLTTALAWAEPPSQPPAGEGGPAASDEELNILLSRVAKHARRIEQMEKRASFVLKGRMEELDRQGKIDGTKELVVRVIAKPSERILEIVRYLEDGADKTAEARERQKREEAKPQDPKKKFTLPFSPTEQARYRFSIAERSKGRLRVAFQPLEVAENAYAGSAWIDLESGELLTMGFSPSKNPIFVDQVDIRVRFENPTSLGRAPSAISFEARGSLLLFKKHFRGSATLSDAKIAF